MTNHLSIFSFNTIEGLKPSSAFIYAILILVCFRVLFIHIAPALQITPGSKSTNPDLSNILHISRTQELRPSLVFMGSSRFLSGVLSSAYTEPGTTSENPSSPQNVSMHSGGLWEALVLLRRNPGFFSKVNTVVLEVEPWMFNANKVHPIQNEKIYFEKSFPRWATLTERIEVKSWRLTPSLILDYFIPTYEKRSAIGWLETIWWLLHAQNENYDWPIFVPHFNHEALISLAEDATFRSEYIVEKQLNEFQVDPRLFNQLTELIEKLHSQEIKILIIQPPVKAEYIRKLRSISSRSEKYDALLAKVTSLARDNTEVRIWETAKDADLPDDIFIDYGHYTLHGAELLSNRIAIELCNLDWWCSTK